MNLLALIPLVIAVVIVVRVLAWAAGWSPLPAGVQLGNAPGEIPCLHDLPKFEGRWTNLDPGKVPGKGWWYYRHFDKSGGLVYCGLTNDAKRRFGQHVETGKAEEENWFRWELYKCPTEQYMIDLEKVGILFHNPATNKVRWNLTRTVEYGNPAEYIHDELDAMERDFDGVAEEYQMVG